MQDNTHPLVSIGIPTYNRADDYFRQAITSALNQTYPSIEIIVGDNGSTDGTEELVSS
nr:glycosyltransferase [Nitrospinaceae bacterium]NIR57946.1 glycosyltransferase [Nitrospinaceae bacterium]NIS88411.1 glycosyltransferase [Nitrospinaceae bacterium]NIT85284.1 glycosyltransferase [Nitrospinaceae bacterium]NIU47442.1 glycosyltransferase [Nitrospinaceae bacterium]